MTSLTIDVTETTLILDKVFFQVYSSKRGYFYNNQNKGASLLLLDLHKSFIMVGTFEREAFTKFITLFILRLPAKIQKNSLPPLVRKIGSLQEDADVENSHNQVMARVESYLQPLEDLYIAMTHFERSSLLQNDLDTEIGLPGLPLI